MTMLLSKYSMGIGDRFAQQGPAQLSAFTKALASDVTITPVWNKSHREHTIVHSQPESVRQEAVDAVHALDWQGPFHVDADHIGMANVDLFIEASDFFTLDVAEAIGQAASEKDMAAFVDRHRHRVGPLPLPILNSTLAITEQDLAALARKYLLAVQEAGRLYRHIESRKGAGTFITEVSMDETDTPQTPLELYGILAALADEGVPAQTIAPKFSGRFNKGIDYVGDVADFSAEFEQDLAVISRAVEDFDWPVPIKLSVHSGSDKFSLYRPMREAMTRFDSGLHIKTAGTTWLEEITGLALADGDGLALAKAIYSQAHARFDELCGPYASVIDIDPAQLPPAATVNDWSSDAFAAALRHNAACPHYNPHIRQLLHVAYKVAAEMGQDYLAPLRSARDVVAEQVATNIYERHLKPLFL